MLARQMELLAAVFRGAEFGRAWSISHEISDWGDNNDHHCTAAGGGSTALLFSTHVIVLKEEATDANLINSPA